MVKDPKSVRLGEIAVEWGLLSSEELEALIVKTNAPGARKTTRRRLLGELLVHERFASAAVLEDLVREQRARRFGRRPEVTVPCTGHGLESWLHAARAAGALELLLLAGRPPLARIGDAPRALASDPLDPASLQALIDRLFNADQRAAAAAGRAALGSVTHDGTRYRAVLASSEQGASLSLHAVGQDPAKIPTKLPEPLARLASLRRGLVVVAGVRPATRAIVLAQLVELINDLACRHVVTLDRVPAYEHKSRKALISQREVGTHTASYASALRATLREDPDVLSVGELRDPEAIGTALLAAETGHLVLASVHASDPTQAVRRLVDTQGLAQRGLARATLANTLQAIVVATLVAGKEGEPYLVADLLPGSPAILTLIREDRLQSLDGAMRTQPGSISRDDRLRELLRTNKIGRITALGAASEPDRMGS